MFMAQVRGKQTAVEVAGKCGPVMLNEASTQRPKKFLR
jgi:hypothetical protein